MTAVALRVSGFPAGPLLLPARAGRRAALNQALVRRYRQRTAPSRQPSPSVAVLDAQSVKCSERGVLNKGVDAHKRIQGRKRQLVVDTGGLLLAAHVPLLNRPLALNCSGGTNEKKQRNFSVKF